MLKRTILSAAAILAGALILASCGSTSQAAAPAAPAAPVIELAEGETSAFDLSKKPNAGTITTDYKVFIADVVISSVKGSEGSTLVLKEGSNCKYLTENGETFLATGKKDSARLTDPSKGAAATLELTTAEPQNIKLTFSGNGDDAGAYRYIALCDASGAVLASKDKMVKSPVEEISVANAPAGVYTIYLSGARLFKVSVSK